MASQARCSRPLSTCAAVTPNACSRRSRITWTASARMNCDLLDQVLACSAIGSRDTVKNALEDFIEQTEADELMITSQIFDQAARLRSYEITADIRAVLD